MVRHHFTPVQANKTLPLVRMIVADILKAGKALNALANGELVGTNLERFRKLRFEVRNLIEELEKIGCSYKDWGFEHGLVDFPSEIDGEKVMLCWRSDEPDVRWYHSYEAGFAGRTEIPAALLHAEQADQSPE